MTSEFIIYGANGFLGQAIARLALQQGHRPLLAGRNEPAVTALANELGLDHLAFPLGDTRALDSALADLPLILNCAGPFSRTAETIADACIRTHTHYLDITGEVPVYTDLQRRDAQAKAAGVMLLPGTGFDVMATDCLALHLKQRLPSATHLTLAFHIDGPAPMPPGTVATVLEIASMGTYLRKEGIIQPASSLHAETRIDFGQGPLNARRLTWGDVFTAYYSTSIPNIQTYVAFPGKLLIKMRALEFIRPLLKYSRFRGFLQNRLPAGPTPAQQAATRSHIWGKVEDNRGNTATARLHGPEAGVIWTSNAALLAIKRILDGDAPPGYQTPASAYGPNIVLEYPQVIREDI